MQNKTPLRGFPFTEEDINGVHQAISEDHLWGVAHIVARLNYIFDQHKTIKVKKEKNNDK